MDSRWRWISFVYTDVRTIKENSNQKQVHPIVGSIGAELKRTMISAISGSLDLRESCICCGKKMSH